VNKTKVRAGRNDVDQRDDLDARLLAGSEIDAGASMKNLVRQLLSQQNDDDPAVS